MGNISPIVTQIETKQGEILVTINLNLNLKLDHGNILSVEGNIQSIPKKPEFEKVKLEKPDFTDNYNEIIDFGKQV